MMTMVKKMALLIVLGLVSGIGIVILSDYWVSVQTKERTYHSIDELPNKDVALVLGTSPRTRNNLVNLYFHYRMQAAEYLYKQGKIKHLILSGDNRTRAYNEPNEMRKALIKKGIPESAMTLDYAGFRTLDSVIRAKEIFSQKDLIVVSQAFHNQRAIFIADHYQINLIGFNAQDVSSVISIKVGLREYLARFKAILDIYILHTPPKFLGEKVEIKL